MLRSNAGTAREIFPIGEVVGGCYEVRGVLGSGGMGMVYEARDRELNRSVAIKACWPDFDTEWLVSEARVMAAFQHVGLPVVHALGTHRGVRYVVMEHLRGRTLNEHLKDFGDGLTMEETRDILLAVAESLQVLHSANLVHRDIKPGNVMLVPPRRIVLVDFGITDMAQYIPEQQVAGSPHYIAPEVVTGKVYVAGAHLMDIYALGVLGYQMLAGRTPFASSNLAEVLDTTIREEAPPITRFRPELSSEMAGLVMEMLSKDPGDRPLSIEEVVTRLRTMQLVPVSVAPAKASPDRPSIRVLIADDEPAVWDVMAYVLEDHGYELVRVADGAEALEAFREKPFEIVITDKKMPRLDGLELSRIVKEQSPDTDVIMVSAYASPLVKAQAFRFGATYLLEKPFKIDQIADLVYELADKHRERQAGRGGN